MYDLLFHVWLLKFELHITVSRKDQSFEIGSNNNFSGQMFLNDFNHVEHFLLFAATSGLTY